MADIYAESRIEAVQNAYHIGYMNDDVRIAYKKDVKMTVGNITIDAKEGDLSSLSRWVAKILAEQGAVEIQDTDMYIDIKRAIGRERLLKQHDLSGIDVDFYVKAKDYLSTLKDDERKKLSIELKKFASIRAEKIVLVAAASPMSADLEGKLSAEEKELYKIIHDASMAFKNGVSTIDRTTDDI